MQKKIILLVILMLIVIGAWLYLFLTSPMKEEPKEIMPTKIKLSEIKIVDITPLSFIAMEKGFFEKEGLKINLKYMSQEDAISALLAGEVDYVHFVSPHIKLPIMGSLRNAPIKIIMLTYRHQISYLISQPELSLNNLKNIAIFPMHYQAIKFIEENNLKEKTTTTKTLKETEALLTSGTYDAILISSQVNARQLEIQGYSVDILLEILPFGLGIRNDRIEENPNEIEKTIRALRQAMEFIITRPEETKELLSKLLQSKKQEENTMWVERNYSYLKNTLNRKFISYDEGTELLIKIAKAGNFETIKEVEKQVVTLEEIQKVFDFRFVE